MEVQTRKARGEISEAVAIKRDVLLTKPPVNSDGNRNVRIPPT
jgi:hypothetical protein